MQAKVVESCNVQATTVTVLFQQKQANHEYVHKFSITYFVIANNDNWLLTAIIYLWILELLLLNSEFLLACFCPVFSWSDNQGWLAGGVWRSARIYDSSVLSRFCFDAAMKSIGRPGKELRRNEIDRGWIPYIHCMVLAIYEYHTMPYINTMPCHK